MRLLIMPHRVEALDGCQLDVALLYEVVADDVMTLLLPINVMRNYALVQVGRPRMNLQPHARCHTMHVASVSEAWGRCPLRVSNLIKPISDMCCCIHYDRRARGWWR